MDTGSYLASAWAGIPRGFHNRRLSGTWTSNYPSSTSHPKLAYPRHSAGLSAYGTFSDLHLVHSASAHHRSTSRFCTCPSLIPHNRSTIGVEAPAGCRKESHLMEATSSLRNVTGEESRQRPWTSVYIAASLDGFIATKDGGLAWLETMHSSAYDGEDYGYKEFMATVDAVLMGRKTYDVVKSFDKWHYEGKQVFVLTHRPITPVHDECQVSGALSPVLTNLHANEIKKVYLDGGMVIQAGLREGVVDDIIVSIIPVLLGDGIPLFGSFGKEVPLQLVSSKAYKSGLVQLKYEIRRS